MAKKLLITATDLMMIQFLAPHVERLAGQGYEIDLACSNVGGRIGEVRARLEDFTGQIHVVRLHRSPAKPGNLNGYKDLRKIIDKGHYDLIWTNEPVMGVMTRLAAQKARKRGTKVLYMVHGFHFYDGAPAINWMVYYPIERLMASKADAICTVNKEDFKRAKTFKVDRVEYIHGIGVDTGRLQTSDNRCDIRKELSIPNDAFIVLSVGELNKNKNQAVIIEAIARLDNPNIHYVLCGKGDQREALEQLAAERGLMDKVHFLGYRKDVVDICAQVDLFAHPSKREGLGLAALEAMYAGLPLVTSKMRGSFDFMQGEEAGFLFEASDFRGFSKGIEALFNDVTMGRRIGSANAVAAIPFTLDNVKGEVQDLVSNLLSEGDHA